jgi:uncharacterized OB-fold protein
MDRGGLSVDLGIVRADARSAPFFEAAARDELLIKRCGQCSRWLGPDATGCPGCGASGSDDAGPRWAAASGRGTVISFAVPPAREGEEPCVLALVELAEGPWLHTRLNVDPADAVVGMAVTARFEHPAEGESYPLFWPT